MKKLVLLLPFLLALACQPASKPEKDAAAEAAPAPPATQTLDSFFEEVNVVKMHLFATQDAAPAEGYPYAGKPVTGEALKLLDEALQPNALGGVFACYRTENGGWHILRVPGKQVAGDLALARWDAAAGKLVKVADLAWLFCDEGICHQQDAWLTDLDDSRTFELITRSRTTEKGKVAEEAFTVVTEDGKGGFAKADEALAALALKGSHVMMKN